GLSRSPFPRDRLRHLGGDLGIPALAAPERLAEEVAVLAITTAVCPALEIAFVVVVQRPLAPRTLRPRAHDAALEYNPMSDPRPVRAGGTVWCVSCRGVWAAPFARTRETVCFFSSPTALKPFADKAFGG